MRIRRSLVVVMLAGGAVCSLPDTSQAQCCLTELFAGCCRKAPAAFAVAPVAAPVVAPVAAPVPAPPPPVVVPVQQVSYVPETTYRTQYQCVPVTSYKPTTEIDPCTGCQRECMAPVTQYVQQAVNVPVTQYRAVYSTKYVQMQPGYAPGAAPALPAAGAPLAPAAGGTVASPFSSTIQTTPQAWGAAGADVPQQLIQPAQPQGITAPAMVPQSGVQPPAYQPTYQQPIVPQGGVYATPNAAPVQPQPTTPPALAPAPSLKPIPELPRTSSGAPSASAGATNPSVPFSRSPVNGTPAPSLVPQGGAGSGTTSGEAGTNGSSGMPVVPGAGPTGATGAFPKLLEPTGHTTSWRMTTPAQGVEAFRSPGYPTASLPGRVQ